MISKVLQTLGLQPRISKKNSQSLEQLFSQQVRTILEQNTNSFTRIRAFRRFYSSWNNKPVKNKSLADLGVAKTAKITYTVFPHIVSILNLEIVANSNSCRNISISYITNWILAAETIQGRILYKEIWYSILDLIRLLRLKLKYKVQ